MYKEHLVENVTSSLNDLANFIRKADEGNFFLTSHLKILQLLEYTLWKILGLLQPVPEGDYDALINVMGYLMHVKDRTAATDEMFHPLTETIELLKFYDMDIPEEVNVLLQVNTKHLLKKYFL